MPEKAWEKVHFDERWEGTVKSIFGMNLSDYADGEQDTEKLKVMAAPDEMCIRDRFGYDKLREALEQIINWEKRKTE